MFDILNLALPYFGVVFIGFACGKWKKLPESGLAWMNFFLLYVSLPALMFNLIARTPFAELSNPPFLVATTLATMFTFSLALLLGKLIGRLSLRERPEQQHQPERQQRVDHELHEGKHR
ncbi:MAG: AEC family transporter, partial [Bradyrhizobium sp.]|uniref:AEC family transporter n=1 Tax=Bradyrhizobium sp. TaxID=376 RepID=UPI00391CBEFF